MPLDPPRGVVAGLCPGLNAAGPAGVEDTAVTELSYLNLYKNKERACENLTITCVDFRFRKEIGGLLSRAGYDDFDLLALPGASKALIEEPGREVCLQAIGIVLQSRRSRRVIVVDHIDCAAYEGSGRFSNQQEEEAFHTDKLHQAARAIKEYYPSLEVVLMYMDWEKLKSVPAESA